MPTEIPHQVLRHLLLWSAAMLVNTDQPIRRLRVRVEYVGGAVEFRQVSTDPNAPPDPATFMPTAQWAEAMGGAFFSGDECEILKTLGTGTLTLKALSARTGIKRSRCAILAGNLRDRGVLTSDNRGYSLTAGPWPELAASSTACQEAN